jgi:hypothetical protein
MLFFLVFDPNAAKRSSGAPTAGELREARLIGYAAQAARGRCRR